jgi:hypothetical protein
VAEVTPGFTGQRLTGEELARLRSITVELRARRMALRELIGTVRRLEVELEDEILGIQALSAEGRLIIRGRRATS